MKIIFNYGLRGGFIVRSLLIVGADHLGVIPQKLGDVGFGNVVHMSGRKVQMVKRGIPEDVDIVLVLTDYINHNLSNVIKQKAKEQSVPIYFAKRSWSSISKVLMK
jgi:hypothetical protein